MSLVFNMVGGGGGGGIKLTGISITTPPTKTTYTKGETFDPAGMVVVATYSNGATLACTGYSYEPNTPLDDGTTKVTIRYTEGGVTKTAEQTITVIHRLTKIEITAQPTKKVYEYGDSFQSAGMVVKATYSDGATANVTGYSCSPATLNTVGTQTITVSYTERNVTKTATTSVTVNRKTISTVPSQSGSLTYNGGSQSPTWNNYNTAQLTIGGTTTGTNAGSYTATFTPKSNYRWADGTTTAKSVSWSIGKAAGSLSISPASMTLDTTTKSKTITVTRSGDGTISAVSSNTAAATVSVSGNTVTVTGKANGSATITISVAAGTNYTAPANKTCEVSVNFASRTLNDNDWATIRAVSDAGQGANYWAVGDTKTITINGKAGDFTFSNLSIDAYIIGFNHNSAKEGSNRIHFLIGKSGGKLVGLCDRWYGNEQTSDGCFNMNTSKTNSGGWNGSAMRNTLLGNNGTPSNPTANTLLAAFPSDLRAVMKSVTKYTDNTGNSSNASGNVTATSDYLFLLSEFEVQGARSYANQYEQNSQAQYDYFKAGNSKIAYKHTATGTAVFWWLRSATYVASKYFCTVNTDGSTRTSYASFSAGVLPGFAV